MSLKKRVNNAQAAAAPQKQPGQLVAVGNVGADIPGGVDGGKQNFDNDNGRLFASQPPSEGVGY